MARDDDEAEGFLVRLCAIKDYRLPTLKEQMEMLAAYVREREARIWEEAAKFVSLHGLSPGTRGMCVELAKAMNEKAAALRARGGKQ